MSLGQTPSQTIGPFFAYGLVAQQYGYDHPQSVHGTIETDGNSITIYGNVLDGNGEPVVDALVEVWGSKGVARQGTGANTEQSFTFAVPKPTSQSTAEAPHLTLIIFMRGLLSHLYTRIYFEDEFEANKTDVVLSMIAAERQQTLIAKREGDGKYRFDIHLQGDRETVFFDL